MNRLTSGTVSLIALLVVSGCNNDPTEDLRTGVSRIQAAPSQLTVNQGKTKTVQVTAVDDQGNPLETAYEVTSTGPGISVKRDSSFFPVFINDTLLTVPPTAPTFQFIVTGTELTTTSFVVSAEGTTTSRFLSSWAPIRPTCPGPPRSHRPGRTPATRTVIAAQAPFLFNPGCDRRLRCGERNRAQRRRGRHGHYSAAARYDQPEASSSGLVPPDSSRRVS